MKALLLTKYQKLEITDMPQPEPGAKEVLVRVGACGICGSDIHGWDGSSGRRIPPLVMGHEAAGEVAATSRAPAHSHCVLKCQDNLQARSAKGVSACGHYQWIVHEYHTHWTFKKSS